MQQRPVLFLLSWKIVLPLPLNSVATAVVRNDFNEKVLLKLSSLVKFSQNLT